MASEPCLAADTAGAAAAVVSALLANTIWGAAEPVEADLRLRAISAPAAANTVLADLGAAVGASVTIRTRGQTAAPAVEA